jgi:hypothetical protein
VVLPNEKQLASGPALQEFVSNVGGRQGFAIGCILARPQRREIAQAFGFCGGSQWRDGRGGQGKAGSLRIQGAKVAHECVDNAARRATTEQIGQSGVLR